MAIRSCECYFARESSSPFFFLFSSFPSTLLHNNIGRKNKKKKKGLRVIAAVSWYCLLSLSLFPSCRDATAEYERGQSLYQKVWIRVRQRRSAAEVRANDSGHNKDVRVPRRDDRARRCGHLKSGQQHRVVTDAREQRYDVANAREQRHDDIAGAREQRHDDIAGAHQQRRDTMQELQHLADRSQHQRGTFREPLARAQNGLPHFHDRGIRAVDHHIHPTGALQYPVTVLAVRFARDPSAPSPVDGRWMMIDRDNRVPYARSYVIPRDPPVSRSLLIELGD